MSVLLPIIAFILATTGAIYGMSPPDWRLRVLSVFWLVMLLLTSSTIATEWSRMTNLVLDDDDFGGEGLKNARLTVSEE